MKTIFLVIGNGLITRNILRSGVLGLLKEANFRIIIFFSQTRTEIPQYLRDEFKDASVIVEGLPDTNVRGRYLFSRLSRFLILSKSGWVYNQKRDLQRSFFWKYLNLAAAITLSRFFFLKRLARFIDERFFANDAYAHYFELYKPDVVFSTSIISKFDQFMMKEAYKRGVKTVSMPKGWDNITKQFYLCIPDRIIVQNVPMKHAMVEKQSVNEEKIVVCGFPQFDWYRKPEILETREQYCASMGIDPRKKIIFFGSEGVWAPDDDYIVSLLAQWVSSSARLAHKASLIIRPHFSDVKKNRFDKYKQLNNVAVDDDFTLSDFFTTNWDPQLPDIKKLANLLHHSDIVISVASTITLDAVCFDKPLINIGFSVIHHPRSRKDLSHLLYETDHYQWILKTKGIDIAHSEKELLNYINEYLKNPARKSEERKKLVDELCFQVDGRSSERIADVIKEMVA